MYYNMYKYFIHSLQSDYLQKNSNCDIRLYYINKKKVYFIPGNENIKYFDEKSKMTKLFLLLF